MTLTELISTDVFLEFIVSEKSVASVQSVFYFWRVSRAEQLP